MSRRRAPGPALSADVYRGLLRAAYVWRFLAGQEARLAALRASEVKRTFWPADLDTLRYRSSDPEDERLVQACDEFARWLWLPELAGQVYQWLHITRARDKARALAAAPSFLGAFSSVEAVVGDGQCDGRRPLTHVS